MRPPSGVALTALEIKLASTRSICLASAMTLGNESSTSSTQIDMSGVDSWPAWLDRVTKQRCGGS